MKPAILFLILFTSFATHCYATDTLSERYPAIVLVQLPSEQNRINAMKRNSDYTAPKEVIADAKKVREKMIADFTDNYHYCPVYYYIDTNAELVKKRQFQGILMNADGTIVKKEVIAPGDDDYVIVYYGRFLSQGLDQNIVPNSTAAYDPDNPNGKGLVVLNDQYQQIDRFFKYGYDEIVLNFKRREIRKRMKKYIYNSKYFDIEYYPFAALFEQNFHEHYSRHRLSPGTGNEK